MPTQIKIPVSYILDEDGSLGLLLLSDEEREQGTQRVAALQSEHPEQAKALQAALDLDADLRDQDNSIHRTYTFRRPTTQDRMQIRHLAHTKAEANGPVVYNWVFDQYLLVAAVEVLLEGENDIHDDLLEHVAALLDAKLAVKVDASSFLRPKAKASPAASK